MPERGLSFVDVPLGTRPSTDVNYTLNGYARTVPSLSKSLNNTLSYYVSGSYMYDDRYALNFSVRGDGSNRFGQDEKEKYLPVWSIGARWNVTDEHWLQGQDLLNYLSLSATYGYQGNVVENVSANSDCENLAFGYGDRRVQDDLHEIAESRFEMGKDKVD